MPVKDIQIVIGLCEMTIIICAGISLEKSMAFPSCY